MWPAVAALALPFRHAGHSLRGRFAFALGLTLVASPMHSSGYNALAEDPATRGPLAPAASAAPAGRRFEAAGGTPASGPRAGEARR